jgi:hypothetical protein
MHEHKVDIGGPERIRWDDARRRVRYSRVRVWPTVDELVHRGDDSSLVQLLSRLVRMDDHETKTRLELSRDIIHFGIVRLLDALTELAEENGAPWVEMRPPPAHELYRGPQLQNVAGAMAWLYKTHDVVRTGIEAASHPVMVLKHQPGSTYDRLAMRASVGALILDPIQPDPDEHRWVARSPRLAAVHFDFEATPTIVQEWGPLIREILRGPPGTSGETALSTPRFDSVLAEDDGAPANAVDIGKSVTKLLDAVYRFLRAEDAELEDVVTELLGTLTSAFALAIPLAFQRDQMRATPEVVAVGPSDPTPSPEGWRLELGGAFNTPQLATLHGKTAFFVSKKSVVQMQKALRQLLWPVASSPYCGPQDAHPDADANFNPTSPWRKNTDGTPVDDLGSSSRTQAVELPDVGELMSFVLCELADAVRDGRSPFAVLDRRIRLARLAQHMVHVAIPRGTAVRFLDQPMGNLRVALDGAFAEDIHPSVFAELHLPYQPDGRELRIRTGARIAATYDDLHNMLHSLEDLIERITGRQARLEHKSVVDNRDQQNQKDGILETV